MTRQRRPILAGLAVAIALVGGRELEDLLPRPPGIVAGAAAPRSCGCSHACRPATYQGCGCREIGCFPGGKRLRALEADAAASAALAARALPAPCVDGMAAGTFPCSGLDLESYVSLDVLSLDAASGSNLWGFADADDGREYAVIGVSNGTSVVDVTDPAAPRVVGAVPGPQSAWREVKVYQKWNPATERHDAFAYVVSEAPTAGLQILDLSNVPDSVSLAATFRAFDTSHTVSISNVDPATGLAADGGAEPVLYVQGARQPTVGIFALSIADPRAPAVLGRYTETYGHDTWIGRAAGERAAACAPGHDPCDIVVVWTGRSVRVLDWTEKTVPRVISETLYADLAYPHSGWISTDGDYLFSMDEFDERVTGADSRVRIFDVHDWAHPVLAGVWTSDTHAIEHNGYTRGDRYYLSHYERGVTILDVRDPLSPIEAAFFDTFPAGEAAEFHGAWGVYPYLPSGTILASNIDGAAGLFILRESPTVPREPVVPPAPRPHSPRSVDGPRPIP